MFAGPIAKEVRIKHRFQDGLQISASDFVSNAVSNRWNAQRPDVTTCGRAAPAEARPRRFELLTDVLPTFEGDLVTPYLAELEFPSKHCIHPGR
jgi:hypothetical protein